MPKMRIPSMAGKSAWEMGSELMPGPAMMAAEIGPIKEVARRALSTGEEKGMSLLDQLLTFIHGPGAKTAGNGTGAALSPEEIAAATAKWMPKK